MKIKAEILRSEIARLRGLAQEFAEDEAHAKFQAAALASRPRGYEHPAQRQGAVLRLKVQAVRSKDAAATYTALARHMEALLADAQPETRTFWSDSLKRSVCIPQ